MSLLSRSLIPLFREHAETHPVTYTPPLGAPFEWRVIVGAERGGELYLPTGDVNKVIRRKLVGDRATLAAHNVKSIQTYALVKIDNVEWSIDLQESHWGEVAVVVGVLRRVISRHEEMETHGSV